MNYILSLGNARYLYDGAFNEDNILLENNKNINWENLIFGTREQAAHKISRYCAEHTFTWWSEDSSVP